MSGGGSATFDFKHAKKQTDRDAKRKSFQEDQ